MSYFEWLQNRAGDVWTLAEVDARLRRTMTEATDAVLDTAAAYSCSLREAAYITALERLKVVLDQRGLFP